MCPQLMPESLTKLCFLLEGRILGPWVSCSQSSSNVLQHITKLSFASGTSCPLPLAPHIQLIPDPMEPALTITGLTDFAVQVRPSPPACMRSVAGGPLTAKLPTSVQERRNEREAVGSVCRRAASAVNQISALTSWQAELRRITLVFAARESFTPVLGVPGVPIRGTLTLDLSNASWGA
ncbi:hypothetical protein DUI87_21023 [Hirundo rustica rustica]|uniref:Uncharacterized protein n=1 Tax=Hirundo rustica rustica TaxID=333673 RepID=A0A3M0JLF0_HIRRU|nr:hypothetical protein DUI87_21023 [Hirundo rustica rustica]